MFFSMAHIRFVSRDLKYTYTYIHIRKIIFTNVFHCFDYAQLVANFSKPMFFSGATKIILCYAQSENSWFPLNFLCFHLLRSNKNASNIKLNVPYLPHYRNSSFVTNLLCFDFYFYIFIKQVFVHMLLSKNELWSQFKWFILVVYFPRVLSMNLL